jgi:23S rRNA (adenine-N6)-dimethyltransferase
VAVRARPSAHSQHFLRSSALAREIVGAAGIRPGDLVLDLGAGTGVLTRALALRGARVVAVEFDPRLAAGLRKSFPDVVEADIVRLPLPREPFRVVASLPFDRTTDVLRHLLDDPRTPLERGDLIVEWGVAVKRTRVWPSTVRGVLWGAWYELRIGRHLPAAAFRPPPTIAAGVLVVTRRPEPLVPDAERDRFGAFVARGFRRGLRSLASRSDLRRLGVAAARTGRELDAHAWAALYASVRRIG